MVIVATSNSSNVNIKDSIKKAFQAKKLSPDAATMDI